MDEIEYLLLQKNECRAYEIPPAARSTGHLAEEWKNCIFQGKLKIIAKGKFCYIQLLNRENELFVSCQVNPEAFERSVERCRDSSRYYVLTLVAPNGANVYIGMGFEERNDAFDFWAALVDFVDRVKNENKPVVETAGPDLSHLQLRQGQTFSLGGSGNNANSVHTTGNSVNQPPAAKLFKLKPPPRN